MDDDHKVVSLVELYLKREGFRVIAAHDGAQALELFDRHRPDFIILDLLLPEIDGISVCQRIRETSLVPILMLTAKVEEMDKVVGLQAGAERLRLEAVQPPGACGARPGHPPSNGGA